MAESIQTDLVAGRKLKNWVTFSRNIQLLFKPSKELQIDSALIKIRKKLTHEHCEQILSLKLDKMILWTAAFAPSI